MHPLALSSSDGLEGDCGRPALRIGFLTQIGMPQRTFQPSAPKVVLQVRHTRVGNGSAGQRTDRHRITQTTSSTRVQGYLPPAGVRVTSVLLALGSPQLFFLH